MSGRKGVGRDMDYRRVAVVKPRCDGGWTEDSRSNTPNWRIREIRWFRRMKKLIHHQREKHRKMERLRFAGPDESKSMNKIARFDMVPYPSLSGAMAEVSRKVCKSQGESWRKTWSRRLPSLPAESGYELLRFTRLNPREEEANAD